MKVDFARGSRENARQAFRENAEYAAGLLAAKRGVTHAALADCGALAVRWPRSRTYGQPCVALPFYKTPGDARETGYALLRADGELFEGYKHLDPRKIHTLAGKQQDGWCFLGEPQTVLDAHTIWKCEGPTDLLALAPLLPEGHAAISNLFGAGSRCYGADIAWLAGKTIVVAHDNDDAGRKGAKVFADRILDRAREVRILTLPEIQEQPVGDVRAFVVAGGTVEQLLAAVDATPPYEPDANHPSRRRGPAADDDRVPIEVTADEAVVNLLAAGAVGNDPDVYERGGLLVHLVVDARPPADAWLCRPKPAPRIAPLRRALVRHALTRTCYFYALADPSDADGEREHRHPDGWCVDALTGMGHWPGVRPLAGVLSAAALRPDGTVLGAAGYDPATGWYLRHASDPEPIPENPTLEDASAARDTLLELVGDFPFESDAHRAAWVAALLTAFARPAFAGPAPLVLIDNIAGTFGGPALDAALTGEVWQGRILGKSQTISVTYTPAWFATGNNVVLAADTSRRVCHVRLRSLEERPEDREGFRHPDIRGHVRQTRGRYAAAALTILQGYCVAGRPDQKLKPWGSFEGWSDLVRQAVVWCGLADPGTTRVQLEQQSDVEAVALRALLRGLESLDGGQTSVTASEILAAIDDPQGEELGALKEAVETLARRSGKRLTSVVLGRAFGRFKERVVDGRMLSGDSCQGTMRWRVVPVEQGQPEPPDGDHDGPTTDRVRVRL